MFLEAPHPGTLGCTNRARPWDPLEPQPRAEEDRFAQWLLLSQLEFGL